VGSGFEVCVGDAVGGADVTVGDDVGAGDVVGVDDVGAGEAVGAEVVSVGAGDADFGTGDVDGASVGAVSAGTSVLRSGAAVGLEAAAVVAGDGLATGRGLGLADLWANGDVLASVSGIRVGSDGGVATAVRVRTPVGEGLGRRVVTPAAPAHWASRRARSSGRTPLRTSTSTMAAPPDGGVARPSARCSSRPRSRTRVSTGTSSSRSRST
jgi:hypothetical protein